MIHQGLESSGRIYTMNIALWIAQGLLAVEFLYHGWTMWSPPAKLMKMMAYVHAIQPGFRRFIGAAELLAAVGLILPGLTGILPWLTPLAALGLILVMLSAMVYHVQHKEYPNIVLNLVLLALAVFVAYGRFLAAPL
jgi:putative oxidoreductase